MKWFGKIPIGKDGFPVEFIKGSPIRNFFRLLRFTDRKKTAKGGWVCLGTVSSLSFTPSTAPYALLNRDTHLGVKPITGHFKSTDVNWELLENLFGPIPTLEEDIVPDGWAHSWVDSRDGGTEITTNRP